MQKKWIITATAATLSLGVLGAAAAYTATTAHLANEHGTSIGGGVEGSTSAGVHTQQQVDRLNVALESVLRGAPASPATAASATSAVDAPSPTQPPAQTQQPVQTQQPAQTQQPNPAPQPAPAPAPQSLSSVSVPSPASVDSPPSND